MPYSAPYSAPYMYYVSKVIPDIVKSYLGRCFQVSPDMADFYLFVLTCAECAIGVRGYWRNHLNFLMFRVIDEIMNSNDPREMVIIASRVSPEHRVNEWADAVREDFRVKPRGEECEVIMRLLEMGIIQEKDTRASHGGENQTEPTFRGGLDISRHACEVMENRSQYFEWTRSFQMSVEGRLEERRE